MLFDIYTIEVHCRLNYVSISIPHTRGGGGITIQPILPFQDHITPVHNVPNCARVSSVRAVVHRCQLIHILNKTTIAISSGLRTFFRQRACARTFVICAARAWPRALSLQRCHYTVVDILTGLVGGSPRLIAEADSPFCRRTGFAASPRDIFHTMAEELLEEHGVARVGTEGGEYHVAYDRDKPY